MQPLGTSKGNRSSRFSTRLSQLCLSSISFFWHAAPLVGIFQKETVVFIVFRIYWQKSKGNEEHPNQWQEKRMLQSNVSH